MIYLLYAYFIGANIFIFSTLSTKKYGIYGFPLVFLPKRSQFC